MARLSFLIPGADYIHFQSGAAIGEIHEKEEKSVKKEVKEAKEPVKKLEIKKNGKPVLKVRNPKGESIEVA